MSSEESLSDDSGNWSGVPMTEIYGSQSPWGAPEFPLISPGFNHAVLYHVSSDGTMDGDMPPKPQIGHDTWDHDFVRMPCSDQSLYPVENNGSTCLQRRWDIIKQALQQPITNTKELAAAILTYNTKFKGLWKFRALHTLFNDHLEEEETQYFFNVTLPEIVRLTLDLPKLIQAPIPLLKQHRNRAISLSQQQIASLLANAFFCTFPRRNTTKRSSEYASYPQINFNVLYECSGSDAVLEKLKCLCHYFRRVVTKGEILFLMQQITVPVGTMTFLRRSVPPQKCPQWASSRRPVAATPLHVSAAGTIEDEGAGLVQVDFANKYLGGGVLGRGCVQEEIRFVICPELMISMLFTEVLRPNEALLMIGCERYSKYTGYGSSFQFAGDYVDRSPRDAGGRRRCAVLAIDALPFRSDAQQYRDELIARELNKAWVGMSALTPPAAGAGAVRPGVATGNWGCGAFGGNAHLKSLLQIMAATEARRPMAYFTFGDITLKNDIINMYNLLSKHNATVGQLYKYLVTFSSSGVPKSELYSFIHQMLLDQDCDKESQRVETRVDDKSRELNNSPDLFSQDVDASSTTDLCIAETELHISENVEIPPINEHKIQMDEHMTSDDESRTGDLIKGDTAESNITEHEPTKDKITIVTEKIKSKPQTSRIFEKIHIDNSEAIDGRKGDALVKPKVEVSQTSRLFEEMQKFDDESGKLHLKDSYNFSITNKSLLDVSRNDTEIDKAGVSSEVKKKKKDNRKITDFFMKKP